MFNLNSPTILILVVIFFVAALVLILLMHVRLKQLRCEIDDLKGRVNMTDDELNRLSLSINEFKGINI